MTDTSDPEFRKRREQVQAEINRLDANVIHDNPEREVFFETVYGIADGDAAAVPWADMAAKDRLDQWLAHNPGHRGRAIDIGCGLGDNAEALAAAGYATTAFDFSSKAIDWAHKRFPNSSVAYHVADLFDLPDEWRGAFDLVHECYTLQSIPSVKLEKSIPATASLVAAGGILLVYTRVRTDGSAVEGPRGRSKIRLPFRFPGRGLNASTKRNFNSRDRGPLNTASVRGLAETAVRTVALLLIASGIVVGTLWPWVQLRFLGRELQTLEFSQPHNTPSESAAINLSPSDNPVRVRFRASYLRDGKLPPVKIPLKVVIKDRDGVFLSGTISFPTRELTADPEKLSSRAGKPLEFNVLNAGNHSFEISLAPNPNNGGILVPDIESVTATVIANAPELDDNYKALAVILALSGVYVLMRSRRKPGRKTGTGSPPDQWGRGSGLFNADYLRIGLRIPNV